jgi:hypothetical protein
LGGEKLNIKSKTIQIEKVPETSDKQTWTKFNERLNDLSDQGFKILFTTETYILFRRKIASTRREE